RSLISLGLARCRLEADEPGEALRLSLDTLLAVPREYRSEIMMRTARSLGDTVAVRHGEQHAVREYREALVRGWRGRGAAAGSGAGRRVCARLSRCRWRFSRCR